MAQRLNAVRGPRTRGARSVTLRGIVHGSLALRFGVVWIARHARRARVVPFDLDGARLSEGFVFGGHGGGPASADALAVDEDRRLWVADHAGARVRAFSAFGVELGDLARANGIAHERQHAAFEPCAVAVDGVEHETRLLVGSAASSSRALELCDRNGARLAVLRSRGDPERAFEGVAAVALQGRFAWACERRSPFVQVFRDADFHFAFSLPRARGAIRSPRAVQALADGRCLVAGGSGSESGVWLFDRGGHALACIASAGDEPGKVIDPLALAIEQGPEERRTRVVVLDADADRAQVFTLEGVCYGSFPDLPRT